MSKKKNIRISKSDENPETTELLASSVVKVAEAFEKIQKSPLRQRAIVVLLQNGIGAGRITKSQIQLVLDNLPRLKAWYVKEKRER